MALAAVLATFVGVLVGVLLLAEVATVTELARHKTVHMLLGLTATAVVCVAAFTASAAIAWVAAAAVLGAASAGVLTWRRSLRGRAGGGQGVSRPLLVVHGGAAALAFVLVVLAALR